uniref:Putative secreted protein n=1 Tax=Ixodes ricinus TaxID=34613 RepID=A0A6B0U873_IXORI
MPGLWRCVYSLLLFALRPTACRGCPRAIICCLLGTTFDAGGYGTLNTPVEDAFPGTVPARRPVPVPAGVPCMDGVERRVCFFVPRLARSPERIWKFFG